MRIIAIAHGYPPHHNAGAEWMLHEMLKHLVKKGHFCEVLLKTEGYEFEGVKITEDKFDNLKKSISEADLIISPLKQAGRALNVAEFYGKPFVQIIHNSNYYDILKCKHKAKEQGGFIYVVYNSEFTKKDMNYPNPGVVVHPPIDPDRYKTLRKGKKITLINLFERKGGKFFNDLINALPDHEFLGVEGGYGYQEKSDRDNVIYLGNTADHKKIYSQTRLLLMPSLYESYGRTAIEAMVSGIPVICAPTPGLKESCGDAAVFCDLDLNKWIWEIKKFDDPEYYKAMSKKCSDRAKEVTKGALKELDNFEKFLHNIVDKKI